MYNEGDAAEIVDERSQHRLHQEHRYLTKTLRTTNQIVPHDTSCIRKIIRSGRMMRCKQKTLAKIVRGKVSDEGVASKQQREKFGFVFRFDQKDSNTCKIRAKR